jgi:uncharacterized protein (TIGR03067 family)
MFVKPRTFLPLVAGSMLSLLFNAGCGASEADSKRELKGKINAEMKKFQGTWYSFAIEVNGKQQTIENREDLHIFSGNKWTQKVKGRVVEEGTFTLVERKPYWVNDFKYTFPKKQEGGHWLAIYRFDGNTVQWLGENTTNLPLTVKDEDYKKLPKVFETKKGDGYWFRTCKRLKD